MTIKRFRDLTLFDVEATTFLLACDSIGGIGAKEADVIKVSEEVVGYFLCRVPLMELLSQGVSPGVAVLTLANEKTPTAEGVYRGVAMALEEIGIDPSMILNGSTEENIPTIQTGTGITLIGATGKDFAFSTSPAGSQIYALGIPKVGDAVLEDKGEIVPLALITELKQNKDIFELLPVGSKGCIYEANELARTSGLRFKEADTLPSWAHDSAGPACVVLATVDHPDVLKGVEVPTTLLGTLVDA